MHSLSSGFHVSFLTAEAAAADVDFRARFQSVRPYYQVKAVRPRINICNAPKNRLMQDYIRRAEAVKASGSPKGRKQQRNRRANSIAALMGGAWFESLIGGRRCCCCPSYESESILSHSVSPCLMPACLPACRLCLPWPAAGEPPPWSDLAERDITLRQAQGHEK